MDNEFFFLRYVELSGREGERWVQEFDTVVPHVQLCRDSVKGLRRGLTGRGRPEGGQLGRGHRRR